MSVAQPALAASSIKPESQAMSQGLSLLPDPVTSAPSQAMENYEAVLEDPTVDFPLYMRNTIVVVALGVWVGWGLNLLVVECLVRRERARLGRGAFGLDAVRAALPRRQVRPQLRRGRIER